MFSYYIKVKKVEGGYLIEKYPYKKEGSDKICMSEQESISTTSEEVIRLLIEWLRLVK